MSKKQSNIKMVEYNGIEVKQRINKVAKNKGLSINKLEEETGLAKDTIKNWKGSEPSVMKVWKVAKQLDADMGYLVSGEPSRHNISPEHSELFDMYEELTPERKSIIKNKFNELMMEQRSQQEAIHEGEKKGREKEKKEFIIRMLTHKVDEETIKVSAEISDKDFEAIKQEFIKSK